MEQIQDGLLDKMLIKIKTGANKKEVSHEFINFRNLT